MAEVRIVGKKADIITISSYSLPRGVTLVIAKNDWEKARKELNKEKGAL